MSISVLKGRAQTFLETDYRSGSVSHGGLVSDNETGS